MTIDKDGVQLICDLEQLIGQHCFNPNAYDGYTGEEGRYFRYPVSYCRTKKDLKEHVLTKTNKEIGSINPDCVNTIKYVFGSNQLYVGDAIIAVLDYIEKRFDVDFHELLEEEGKNRKRKLADRKELFSKQQPVEITEKRLIVGEDIPIGKIQIRNSKAEYIWTDEYGITISMCSNHIRVYNSNGVLKYEKQILGYGSVSIDLKKNDIVCITASKCPVVIFDVGVRPY